MPSVKHLLIGGGLASAEAAKQIRRVDAEGSIALVSDEPLLPYNRPPLSKEYLRGEATEPLEFASAADYEELRVTTVLGSAVTSLDAAASTATLDNGEVYTYERVLLATGGSPVRLPVPGADLAGVYYLRNASDADAIGAAAREAKRAVVVGAGFIGLETAASLRQMGLDVTVIEMADAVGSTSQIIKSAGELPQDMFIVATDRGLFHMLRKRYPGKRFVEAPTAGDGAMCKSCAHCPWMAMNELGALRDSLLTMGNEVFVDPEIGERAMAPLQRMLDFPVN